MSDENLIITCHRCAAQFTAAYWPQGRPPKLCRECASTPRAKRQEENRLALDLFKPPTK